jgi:hypothetical protein
MPHLPWIAAHYTGAVSGGAATFGGGAATCGGGAATCGGGAATFGGGTAGGGAKVTLGRVHALAFLRIDVGGTVAVVAGVGASSTVTTEIS